MDWVDYVWAIMLGATGVFVLQSIADEVRKGRKQKRNHLAGQ